MQDWVVENRIHDIISRAFNGDRNKLMEALAKDKVSYPEWRQRIKDDMVVNAMRWQIVDKNIQASPAAMRDEYAAHPERYIAERRVTVSAILLKPGDAEKSDEIDEALKNGVNLVLKQMNDVYQKLSVTPINRLGEKFDPNLENAVLQGTEDEGEPGTVCQVLQKGYMMGDRVLRHAMVKVVPE